jgi:hypothetical protein
LNGEQVVVPQLRDNCDLRCISGVLTRPQVRNETAAL